MVSYSSKKLIQERIQKFWLEAKIWNDFSINNQKLDNIRDWLNQEYENIPEKERIGKGKTYIAKSGAEILFQEKFLKNFKNIAFHPKSKEIDKKSEENLQNFLHSFLNAAEKRKNTYLIYFGLISLSYFCKFSSTILKSSLEIIEQFANHKEWDIRENAAYPFRIGLKFYPVETIEILKTWALSSNENIRRISAECLRPMADVKWLRDPNKNDCVLEILFLLKEDRSVYVRKAVGNNLKDLTKYMPEKILNLIRLWVHYAKIKVRDDLASISKKEVGEKSFYLIWTLKHALRWVRERNLEYHKQIEEILGKNYVLYFNEKKNKLALKK
jgi:3-methyladenine DNA glycosylase AlkC